MNTKIIASLAIIAAVVVVAAGATYAAWHSEVKITGASYETSSMDLMIDSNDSDAIYDWTKDGFAAPNPFVKGLYPGSTDEQILDLKNVGGVPGALTIKLSDATSPWNVLRDNLRFTVTFDGNRDGVFDDNATPLSGTLAEFHGKVFTLGPITSPVTTDGSTQFEGQNASVKIVWEVPFSAGDDIQGKSVSIDTEFGLNQIQ